jgi:hypothetical protein
MIRNPSSSSNVQLMLQLINLLKEKRKNRAEKRWKVERGKDLTPTNLAAGRRV